jgi:hypothetical protein
MPELCRFYGIIVYMFTKDHSPPHFHAKYGEFRGLINIESGELIEGNLPNRALRLLKEWIELHKQELKRNWEESQKDNPKIKKIEPLK